MTHLGLFSEKRKRCNSFILSLQPEDVFGAKIFASACDVDVNYATNLLFKLWSEKTLFKILDSRPYQYRLRQPDDPEQALGEPKKRTLKDQDLQIELPGAPADAIEKLSDPVPAFKSSTGDLSPIEIGLGMIALVNSLKNGGNEHSKKLEVKVKVLEGQLAHKESEIKDLKNKNQALRDACIVKDRQIERMAEHINKISSGSSGISIADLLKGKS